MRKLLNTLYVVSENRYLSLKDGNVLVHECDQLIGQFPLISLEGIVTFSYRGASPALMGECANRGIQLVFMSPQGRFLARTCGAEHGNVLLRKKQYLLSENEVSSAEIAASMIIGKVFNERWVLERALRDHSLRIDVEKMNLVSNRLSESIQKLKEHPAIESIRGIEGETASLYFSVFDNLILAQKEDFKFCGRSRRPPLDRINACLSFAYVLLANDCASALESVGLDSYVGFLHQDRPGRISLALDLEEELRAPVADRIVLTLINNRVLQKKHFEEQDSGAVLLTDEGRKTLIKAWQEKKRDVITHPYLKEKIPWGLVPYVQALLLARFLRGDMDGYPPFLWK